MHLHVTLV